MSKVPGTFKHKPYVGRDRSPEGIMAEEIILAAGAFSAERWIVGECTAMLAREPHTVPLWHLSVAHPTRYPTWDEVKSAVYGTGLPEGVCMAQVLGTVGEGEWVDVHPNCFHLYEIEDPFA